MGQKLGSAGGFVVGVEAAKLDDDVGQAVHEPGDGQDDDAEGEDAGKTHRPLTILQV